MLDMAGASRALLPNATNNYLKSMLVNPTFAASKATWNVAIAGAYTLLEPHIHKDYYTSDETKMWLSLAQAQITQELNINFTMHQHPGVQNGGGTTGMPTMPMKVKLPMFPTIPMELFWTKVSRPVSSPVSSVSSTLADQLDIEYGAVTFETIFVYSRSKVLGLI